MENKQHKKRIRLKGFDYTGHYRYSLTFCTKDKTAYFDDASVISGVAGFLRETSEEHGFRVWSCCFMPDHLHVLVEGERASSNLRQFVSLFKQKSGYWFRRHYSKNVGQGFSLADADTDADTPATLQGRPQVAMAECKDLWQINYYEHVLRSDETTEIVARYIVDNPVRKGIVKDFRDYPFSWCDVFGFVGQGFSPADNASLKACPTGNREDGETVGQGFSPANQASLKAFPPSNPEGLPYKNFPEGLPYKSLSVGTRHAKGFTLIEIVITIVLVSILSGIAAMVILQGVRAFSDEQSRSDVHYQARIAMERIAREIRLIRSTADITVIAADNLRFTDVNGASLGFQWTAPNLNRWNGAANDVLASGITAFAFGYFKGDYSAAALPGELNQVWFIDITMTSQQGAESLQLRTRVHPRNF